MVVYGVASTASASLLDIAEENEWADEDVPYEDDEEDLALLFENASGASFSFALRVCYNNDVRLKEVSPMSSLKKVFVAALAFMLMALSLCATACVGKTASEGDVDITAQWRFESVTSDKGEVMGSLPWESDEDLPSFASDGTVFNISTVPGTVRTGTVTLNDDGSYTLTSDDNGNEFTAVIEGNTLTIYFPENRELAFEAVG